MQGPGEALTLDQRLQPGQFGDGLGEEGDRDDLPGAAVAGLRASTTLRDEVLGEGLARAEEPGGVEMLR